MTTEAGLKGETATGDFDAEQKRYLEGFVAGAQIARAAKINTGARRSPARPRPPNRPVPRRPR